MKTFSDKIKAFNSSLTYTGKLPDGVRVMNPFRENPETLAISGVFYDKYYADTMPRTMILGINPGRLGAGATGIPFTDSKRLAQFCGIQFESVRCHEPSSVFIYKLIEAYGGPIPFYRDHYINSVCPLGFLRKNAKHNWVNCNYYDFPELYRAVKPYCAEKLRQQLDFGINRSRVIILGKKNADFFIPLNDEFGFFEKIEVLPHPRYIVQYRATFMEQYVREFIQLLKS